VFQVVLSASVCTRQGKALVSRQFVEMNRLRVEGLLAAFPKLIGHAKQHTFVETDAVRYVYQPLENNLYLLLVTTKASNIVEDLGTLRLLAKIVPDVSGGLQEHAINEHAFELIFAFDEVLTAGGYKEDVTLSAIRTNLLMDSHEEKIAKALQQSKEDAARAEMAKKAKALQEEKMAQLRQQFVTGQAPTGPVGRMEGFGGGGMPQQRGGFMDQFQQQHEQPAPQEEYNPYAALQQSKVPAAIAPKVLAKSGMKLGGMGGGKKDSLMAAMAAEDNLFGGASKGGAAVDFGFSAPVVAPAAAPSTPLTLVLEEKITVNMNREGAVEACEVKGILNLTANTDVGAAAVISVNKAQLPPSFNFATHPKVDKKGYEQQGILSLKGGKGFPVGRAVGILRWSYGNDDAAPISINCWPEDEGSGRFLVSIEMELTRKDLVLHDVNILLPLGTSETPAIESIDGQYKHDPTAGMMCWHFPVVDGNTNTTGSLEFSISGNNPEAFFPIQIGFRSETLLCPIEITGATHSSSGAPIPNQMTKTFMPESYQVA
jgi:coatomer subunit delta